MSESPERNKRNAMGVADRREQRLAGIDIFRFDERGR